MRHIFVGTALLVMTASAGAQSAAATAASETAAPPLIRTVAADPSDSPLVRAAKRAVASRQNPANRRLVTVASAGGTGRGRVSQGTGPTEGPNLPPLETPAPAPVRKSSAEQQQAAAAREQQVKDRLRQLENEQQRMGAELDEPYGGDVDEDEVDRRMNAIEIERRQLSANPPGSPE